MSRATQTVFGLPGIVFPYAGATAPAGWLLCDGSVKLRADYPALFAAIGTTYNASGETSTQFRVPDLRGEFVRGLDAGRGVDTGRTLGSKQKPTIVAFDLSPTSDATVDTLRGALSDVGGDVPVMSDYPAATLTYATTGVSSGTPSGTAAVRPRNVALNYVIKT
jgi:microcystin-dependent protein